MAAGPHRAAASAVVVPLVIGATSWMRQARIIRANILPLANAMSSVAHVSFLGIGVQDPPTASWGDMISQCSV